ncbi:uncharacterized protein LOC110189760 isoform X2 [Drosophila serrata]|uniref:uncharacterized protein LOC110189760 isoform X2 n=1 Tax=Drosophila serrata TaxID=7274 RepID=UPI000A1D1C35|nr:uncharacterized protein LOC110189760 isoform X2 [Drosophila serrata]
MGRDLNKKVHQFFKFDLEENKSICSVCGIKLSGNHSTNLRRHLTTKHLDIFNEWNNSGYSKFTKCEEKRKISYQTSEEAIVSSLVKIPKAPKRKPDEGSEFLQKGVAHLDNMNAKKPRDDADIYAEGWATMFRELSKEQRLYAKKGIDELLMQGRMNMLSYQGVSSIANIPNNLSPQVQMPMDVYPREHIYQTSTPLTSDSNTRSSFVTLHSQDQNTPVITKLETQDENNLQKVD